MEERSRVKFKTRKKTVKVFICSELGANQQSLGSQHLQQIQIHPDSEIFTFSQLGANQQSLGSQHLHLQSQDFSSHRCLVQASRSHQKTQDEDQTKKL